MYLLPRVRVSRSPHLSHTPPLHGPPHMGVHVFCVSTSRAGLVHMGGTTVLWSRGVAGGHRPVIGLRTLLAGTELVTLGWVLGPRS